MKKLKNNKVLLALALILIVCFGLIIFALFKYFYRGDNTNNYGDRLENIKSHPIHENLESEIKSIYTNNEIDKVEIKNKGRIIYVILNLSEIKKLSDAKSLAIKSLEKFTEDEKGYYDIQFVITCDKEEASSTSTNLYPTMGYKNAVSSVVVWIEG